MATIILLSLPSFVSKIIFSPIAKMCIHKPTRQKYSTISFKHILSNIIQNRPIRIFIQTGRF